MRERHGQEPLPRERVECPDKSVADEIRDAVAPDAVVAREDDRRRRVVVLTGDAPDRVLEAAVTTADREWAARPERFGQTPLTRTERERIDFSETNTFYARSCKAIAVGLDVQRWIDYYDAALTVDEHREVFRRVAGHGVTMRQVARFPRKVMV